MTDKGGENPGPDWRPFAPGGRLPRRSAIGVIAGTAFLPGNAWASQPIEAIAFDAFPIFDPRSVARSAATRLPERGRELAQAWSGRLFGDSWVYTAAGRYASFDAVADNALRYAAESLGLALSPSDRRALVGAYAALDIWPDVKPALAQLRGAGIRLAFCSNLGEAALRANIERSGIASAFDHVLSTDRVRAFKPSAKAYAMATHAFGLPRARIGFAAFGGWDAAGAAWFGYRTAWVNRFGLPLDCIGPGPEVSGPDMTAVLRLAGLSRPSEKMPGS